MSTLAARIRKLEAGGEYDRDRPLGERVSILIDRRSKQLTSEEHDLETYYTLCRKAYPGHSDPNFERGKEIHEAIYGDLLPSEFEAYHDRMRDAPPVLQKMLAEAIERIRKEAYPAIWAKYAPADLPCPQPEPCVGADSEE